MYKTRVATARSEPVANAELMHGELDKDLATWTPLVQSHERAGSVACALRPLVIPTKAVPKRSLERLFRELLGRVSKRLGDKPLAFSGSRITRGRRVTIGMRSARRQKKMYRNSASTRKSNAANERVSLCIGPAAQRAKGATRQLHNNKKRWSCSLRTPRVPVRSRGLAELQPTLRK